MSLRLLWVYRLHSLPYLAQHLRCYSRHTGRGKPGQPFRLNRPVTSEHEDDPTRGLYEPEDKRLPFPGNVGLADIPQSSVQIISRVKAQSAAGQFDESGKHEDQLFVLGQFLTSPLLFGDEKKLCEESSEEDDRNMEFSAFDCPHLLKKEFADLFPARDLSAGSLSLLTISQKTEYDMTSEFDSDCFHIAYF